MEDPAWRFAMRVLILALLLVIVIHLGVVPRWVIVDGLHLAANGCNWLATRLQ
jgi:hypothetical protein